MKLFRRILMIIIFMIMYGTLTVYASSVAISSSNNTLEIGQTATITITGADAIGRVKVASSNTEVITLDQEKVWVENGAVTLIATAKGSGSATITATPQDVADSQGLELSLPAKSINITVNAAAIEPEPEPEPEPDTPSTPNTPVTPTKSNNANLSNLGIRPNDFSGFRAANTSYTVNVPNDVTTIEVYAEKGHDKQTISGTGTKSLDEGSNRFTVTVTAEDSTKKTYTITVIRLAKEEINNPDVEQAPEVKVALSSLSIEGVTINEAFNPDTTEYTALAEASVEKINVNAVANMTDAIIDIAGTEELTEGENLITIRVKSADGNDEKVYTIRVTKKNAEEQIDENNTLTAVVGSLDNNNNTPGNIPMEKLIFCIGIGVIAILGIVFAIIRYKKDQSNEIPYDAIDFVGDINTGEAVKKAATTASKLVNTNIETAQDEPIRKKGRHF